MRRILFTALVWKRLAFFVMLLSQDGFESYCPERKSETITTWVTPEAAVRRYSSKWVFLEISQYSPENISAGVSSYWSCKSYGLQVYLKQTPTQVRSCEYHKFLRKTFFQNFWSACFCLLDKVTVKYVDLLFLIKNIIWGGFYQKGL